MDGMLLMPQLNFLKIIMQAEEVLMRLLLDQLLLQLLSIQTKVEL
jgi:hypothetical protein